MIGDVLAGTLICRALKLAFPEAELHYMIHKNTVPVVLKNPFVDKALIFEPSQVGLSGLISFGKQLHKEKYDAVIDAYGKWESILPAYFSGAMIRIGFYKWYTSIFYTRTVTPKQHVAGSALYHRAQLAQALTGSLPSLDFPKIYLSESEIKDARTSLSEIKVKSSKIIMISVLGSSGNKSLPPPQMAETLDMIAASKDVRLLFNYIPEQKKYAEEIYNLCTAETRSKIVFEFYSKGLREFLGILSQCDALIGNEGGAVNMAKALDIPTFTIFSPWINKSSWDMLTDSDNQIAVHLKDYYPKLYGNRHPKHLKKDAMILYQQLQPALYKNSLDEFVKKITG